MIMQNYFIFNSLFKKNEINEKIEYIINKIYVDAILKVNFNKLKCSKCNSIGNYDIKGYYKRTIIINHQKVRINILRVKCKECNRTHAVFFLDFIPYYQLSSIDCKKIILQNYKDSLYDEDLLYRLRKKVGIFKERIRQYLISIDETISQITVKYINVRRNSYLQIHRGIVILNQSS